MTRGDDLQPEWRDQEPAPTGDEATAAEALRRALDSLDRAEPHEASTEASADAELARALRIALRPPALPSIVQRRLLHEAMRQSMLRTRWTWAGLAAAAAVAFAVSSISTSPRDPTLRSCRSTGELFPAPFGLDARSTDRIDTIAHARSRDFRSNWYARHGVGDSP